jgi:Domain of unknown function (DUF4123)
MTTATVVGPADEEIFTDEHGRIKIQFHWQRPQDHPEGAWAYLLIDNSAYDGEWLTRREENAPTRFGPLVTKLRRSQMPFAALWGNLDEPPESAAAPLLIEWPTEKRGLDFLNYIQSACSGKCALSILYCAEPLDSVVKRLRLRMSISLMGDNYLLRHFDKRILYELLPCLTPHQAQSFISLALAWHYLNRDDEWKTLPAANTDLHDDGLPLELDDAQQEDFLRIGSADRIEAAIGDLLLDENPLEGRAPGERYQWIRARQEDAASHQIIEHSGQLQFCLHALQAGDNFHRETECERVLNQLKAKQATT